MRASARRDEALPCIIDLCLLIYTADPRILFIVLFRLLPVFVPLVSSGGQVWGLHPALELQPIREQGDQTYLVRCAFHIVFVFVFFVPRCNYSRGRLRSALGLSLIHI